MPLDDALRGTLRNFSTLFLVIFVILGPLHLLYGFVFHDVLALRELHPAIEGFPAGRQVRGVGLDTLTRARVWLWVITVLEVSLLPLFALAASHVMSLDRQGEVPTATEAWRRVRSRAAAPVGAGRKSPATIALGALLGVTIGFLTEATVMIFADLVPDAGAFAVIVLARSVGHSAGAAFAVGTFVLSAGEPGATPEKVPDLY